jgi:outer membrane protein assembly factor BamB
MRPWFDWQDKKKESHKKMATKNFLRYILVVMIVFSSVMIFPVYSVEDCSWNLWGGSVGRHSYLPAECVPNTAKLKREWTSKILQTSSLSNSAPIIPLFVDNQVIMMNDTKLVSLNAEDGKKIWSQPGLFDQSSLPCIQNGFIYLVSYKGGQRYIAKRSVKNGKEIWKERISYNHAGSPVYSNGKIYLQADNINRGTGMGNSFVLCFSSEDGKLLWKSRISGWMCNISVNEKYLVVTGSKRTVSDGMIEYHDGVLYCIDIQSGESLWLKTPANWGSGFLNMPIISDEKVYIGVFDEGQNAAVLCFNLVDGSLLWFQHYISSYVYPIGLAGNKLVCLSSKRGFVCLNKDTGAGIWDLFKAGLLEVEAVVSDNLMFVYMKWLRYPNIVDGFFSLSMKTGEILWEHKSEKDFAFLSGGRGCLFATKNDGELICFEPLISKPVPSRLILTPGNASVFPGENVQFFAEVLDQNGAKIETPSIKWKVAGKGGTIDSKGLFTATGDIGTRETVSATFDEFSESSRVRILNPIEILPTEINIKADRIADSEFSLFITNKSKVNVEMKFQEYESWIVDPEFETVSLKPGNNTVVFKVSTRRLKNNKTYEGSVIVSYYNQKEIIPVTVEVSNKSIDCLVISETEIYLSGIDRVGETTKIISVKNISGLTVDVSIEIDSDWLTISPSEFELIDTQELEITIFESKLPPETNSCSRITIKSSENCNDTVFQICVSAPKIRSVELWIDKKEAYVDGRIKQLDVPPMIISDRTYVPLRFISEALDFDVTWEQSEKRVTVIKGDQTLDVWIDKYEYRLGGEIHELESPPLIIDGRTMVPVRFITEAFGAEVEWLADERKVSITLVEVIK